MCSSIGSYLCCFSLTDLGLNVQVVPKVSSLTPSMLIRWVQETQMDILLGTSVVTIGNNLCSSWELGPDV